MTRVAWVSLLASAIVSSVLVVNAHAASRNQIEFQYEQAKRMVSKNAGDPDFDLHYGLISAQAGHCDEAIFAFERLLMIQPENMRARTELARCYYETGQYHQSQQLFDEVASREVPEPVKERIAHYQEAIEERKSAFETKIDGFAEIIIGSDDNINSGTDETALSLPTIGDISLSEDSRAIDDNFIETKAGLVVRKALSKTRMIDASIQASRRDNQDTDQFDLTTLDAELAYRWKVEQQRFRLAAQFRSLQLDGESYYSNYGITAQWYVPMSDRWLGVVTGNLGSVNFDDTADAVRDNTRGMLAGHAVYDDGRLGHAVGLFAVHERASDDTFDFALRDAIIGATYRLSYHLNRALTPYISLRYTESDYGASHPIFQTKRDDSQAVAEVGLQWNLMRQLMLEPAVMVIDNESNIDAYDYERTRAQLGLKYSF